MKLPSVVKTITITFHESQNLVDKLHISWAFRIEIKIKGAMTLNSNRIPREFRMYGISGGFPGLHPRNTWITIALTFKFAPKITENVSQQHYVMTWIPIFRNLVGLRINVILKVAESLWWLADLKPASSGPPYSVTAPRWQCYRSSWGPRPVDALWVPSRLLPVLWSIGVHNTCHCKPTHA